jgi:carbonic anhydrase
MKQVNNENLVMQPFIRNLMEIIKYKSSTETSDIQLNNIIPTSLSKYFRYSGSLTTPACDEIGII